MAIRTADDLAALLHAADTGPLVSAYRATMAFTPGSTERAAAVERFVDMLDDADAQRAQLLAACEQAYDGIARGSKVSVNKVLADLAAAIRAARGE